ncbi:hypothetical protein E1A91_A11G217000v1 [Gossypium mustelinum]|uniref:Uncharacterized protein n=1 Tax=Gossypium mustelinum TaxID=34275 RepID=A0A5D2XCK1_GOSMU|nr:hypothetical protein E1A91_A11G217000v1 [Gossypium mustelinum]
MMLLNVIHQFAKDLRKLLSIMLVPPQNWTGFIGILS